MTDKTTSGTMPADTDPWTMVHDRVAKAAHNAMMADNWDELPKDGIDRAAWNQVAVAVISEVRIMMKERGMKERGFK